MSKSILIPTQQFEFLGWEFNTILDQLRMTNLRRKEMLNQIDKWTSLIVRRRWVKVRWLASLIGKLNFLRVQIKRGGLHMQQLNRCKSKIAINKGWNART
jgi:hypothetical protein